MIGLTASTAPLAFADKITPATPVRGTPRRRAIFRPAGLVDEQEPCVELLGQGNRFGFTEVEELTELQ